MDLLLGYAVSGLRLTAHAKAFAISSPCYAISIKGYFIFVTMAKCLLYDLPI
jgi:hypothetical protein